MHKPRSSGRGSQPAAGQQPAANKRTVTEFDDRSREELIDELVALRCRLLSLERRNGASNTGAQIDALELPPDPPGAWHAPLDAVHDSDAELYDFASVGYVTLDRQGVIECLNLTAARMLGLPRPNLVGHSFAEWLRGSDIDRFHDFLHELRDAEHRATSGLRLISAQNTEHYLQLHGSRLDGGPGATLSYRIAMIDTTTGRIAERALRHSEHRYRSLFDDSPLPLWEIDLSEVRDYLSEIAHDPTITLAADPRRYRPIIHQCIRNLRIPKANRAALELSGITSKEAMKREYTALLTTRLWRTLAAMTDALWRGAKQYVAQTTLRRCDGSIREIVLHVNAAPDYGGLLNRVVIAMIDVTEHQRAERRLRASEQRFRALVEQSPTGTLLFQPDGLLKEANPSCLKRWQATLEQVRGYNIFEDRQLLAQGLMPLMRRAFNGEVVGVTEFEYDPNEQFGSGGQRAWIRRHIYPVRIGNTIAEVVVRDEDVTQEHRAREEARRRQEELVHVARLSVMGEMASSLAHEVSQPLMAILTYADACLEMIESADRDPAVLKRPLLEIAAQASRASEIVRRIRGFVRRETPRRVPADLNRLVDEALQFLDSEVRSRGAQVRRDLEPDLPSTAVDPVLIIQVLVNLMHNALDALEEVSTQQRNLTLRTRLTEAHTLRVECIDTGNGITDDALDRLFDPFYTTKRRGMGMGLSISRTIIESHGGRLTAQTLPEEGTIVGFELPVDLSPVPLTEESRGN